MEQAEIVSKAIKALEILTGFKEGTKVQADSYFAELPELGIKVYALDEPQAIKLALLEAEYKLNSELSLAKNILKSKSYSSLLEGKFSRTSRVRKRKTSAGV